jgi:hypothetical protein
MSTLAQRYWRALTRTSRTDEQPAERGRHGYGLWQRYFSALLGIRLPPKHLAAPVAPASPPAEPSVRGRLIRLPRFDLTTEWLASTAVPEPRAAQWTAAGRWFTVRESGPGEIELLVREDWEVPEDWVVPVYTSTDSGDHRYFMIFVPDEAGGSIGVLRLSVIFPWVDVTVEEGLPVSALDGTLRSIRAEIAESVAATPDPAMPAWAAIAASRPDGDPLSQVIRDAAGGPV